VSVSWHSSLSRNTLHSAGCTTHRPRCPVANRQEAAIGPSFQCAPVGMVGNLTIVLNESLSLLAAENISKAAQLDNRTFQSPVVLFTRKPGSISTNVPPIDR